MGEGGCQLDILDRPRLGRELTYETIPTSIGGQEPQLHLEVLNIFQCMGEYRTLSTFLHSTLERGHVNLIF